MIRVGVEADLHYDERSRFDESIRIGRWILEDMYERNVDVIVIAGDVFERLSTPRERTAVAEHVVAAASIAPVIIVRGNHDAPGDLQIFSRLRAAYPVIVEERAAVHAIKVRGVEARFACLAWPRKAELLALALDASPEFSSALAADALRSILLGFRAQLEAATGPRLLVAHAMVRGSRVSTGQPLVGCDMEIGVEDLQLAGADFVALGHIHFGQDFGEPNGAPVVYPGSPRRTAYGELEPKGYVVSDFTELEAGKWHCSAWERVETPATPMVLIEAAYEEDNGTEIPSWHFAITSQAFPHADRVRGAEVRFRYTTPADRREAAADAARQVGQRIKTDGAIHLQIEEIVNATTRARAPEIAKAITLEQKLRALWQLRDPQLDPARAERLIARVNSIDVEGRSS